MENCDKVKTAEKMLLEVFREKLKEVEGRAGAPPAHRNDSHATRVIPKAIHRQRVIAEIEVVFWAIFE